MSTISSIVSSIYNEQSLIMQGINVFNFKIKSSSNSTLDLPVTNSSENYTESNTSELSNSEYTEIHELQTIDRKVRAHELAHISVGGRFAGGASYEYQTGPDNIQYAVGGEVPIYLITGNTPQETIQNMTQITAAALAPSDPSPQDRSVASTASSYIQKAVAEIYTNTQKIFSNNSNDNHSKISFYA